MTDEPVPYVAFAWPASVQPWPKRAACESANTAAIGVPSASIGTPFVLPKPRSDATAVGSAVPGTPKTSSSSLLHWSSAMSYNRVREALPASQRCSMPPVSRQMSHESTVPRRTSSIGTPFGRWSNIQRIFGAENIGSTRRPLRSCTRCRSSSVKVSLHQAAYVGPATRSLGRGLPRC